MSRGIIAVIVAAGAVIVVSDASLTSKVIMAIALCVVVSLWTTTHRLRLHALINRHSSLGQPAPILELTRAELARSSSPTVQVPFSIYQAVALWMSGRFEEALAVLERAPAAEYRGKARRTWLFLYYSQMVTCLVLAGRAAEAREILTSKLEPLAEVVIGPATRIILDESRAKLAFAENRFDDSRELFAGLAADERVASGSRAFYYYFLGRIAQATGGDPRPDLTRAAELAPDTFLPAYLAEQTAPAGSAA